MAWYNAGYRYKKQITLLHSQVSGGSDLTSFPVLISMTDANLATIAHAGNVQNASGYDLIFVDSTETTLLNFEVEKYVASTGQIIAWVNIPTLSSSADTIIYMYYDNASISTFQGNVNATWNSNYVGVWHMKEGSGTTAADSTSEGNTLTWSGTASWEAGEINEAVLTSSAHFLTNATPSGGITGLKGANGYTFSGWWYPTSGAAHAKGMYFGQGTLQMIFFHDSTSSISCYYGVGAANHAITPTSSIALNAWQKVTLAADSTSGICYINGASAATGTGDSTAGLGITQGIQVGNDYLNNNPFPGGNAEIRILQVKVTAGWDATEYSNQSNPSGFYTVGSAIAYPSGIYVLRNHHSIGRI